MEQIYKSFIRFHTNIETKNPMDLKDFVRMMFGKPHKIGYIHPNHETEMIQYNHLKKINKYCPVFLEKQDSPGVYRMVLDYVVSAGRGEYPNTVINMNTLNEIVDQTIQNYCKGENSIFTVISFEIINYMYDSSTMVEPYTKIIGR